MVSPALGPRKPTVVVARRPRPGREREFERWIRRLVAKAADARGYVDAEVQPPNEFHPDEWVIVYQFTDPESLQQWMRSPARADLLATGNDLVAGDAREQVLALVADGEPVTAVSSVRVMPDRTEVYRALHQQVLTAVRTFDGFLRCDLYEPVPGVQHDTIVILAFDNRANLDRWLSSDVRGELLTEMSAHVEGDRTVNVIGGFAGWFAPAGSSDVKRWKSAVVVLLALIPVWLLYTGIRVWLFPGFAIVPAVILGNVIGIIVLSWVLMPVLTRRFSLWLRH